MTAKTRNLTNVHFVDEIHPDEIPALYSQCSAGIVALDVRHKSHNIPGKFLTYMQCGLPVLGNLNPGNDLAQIIRQERVGEVCEKNNAVELATLATQLLEQSEHDTELGARCRRLFEREFSVSRAVKQITTALEQ
jgi:glycosyltransferase involved in cell wall biosynthesis